MAGHDREAPMLTREAASGGRWSTDRKILSVCLLVIIGLYVGFALGSRSFLGDGPVSAKDTVNWTKQSAIWAVIVPVVLGGLLVMRRKTTRPVLLSYVGLLALFLVFWFSSLYYVIGNDGNFSVSVDKGEAFLMSLGNLTNVGMAQITPRTDAAHLVVVLQGIIDFLFIVVIVGIVIGRLDKSSHRSPAEKTS
jgi:Ion channel